MNASRCALMAALAVGLTGCESGRSSSALGQQHDDPLSVRYRLLQLDPKAGLAECAVKTAQLEKARQTGDAADVDLRPCLVTLPMASDDVLIDVLRRFAPFTDDMRAELALELASRSGVGEDLEAAGEALLDASGFETVRTDIDSVDAEVFSAARGGLRRAAAQGLSPPARRVQELESYEFPLPDRMAHRDALAEVYFRRWPADTLAQRRLLGGFAIGWRDICTQWETGMSSVQYSRGLESLLAPVRAEVPGRLADALPSMGSRVIEAASATLGQAHQNGTAGVVNQGLLAWNGIKRDFDVAMAVASSAGRDAAIAVYQSVGNCRTPRALRLLDSLLGAFDHYGSSIPTPAVPAAPSSVSISKEQSR